MFTSEKASGTPILEDAEVARRKLLLAELQSALDASEIACVLAGRQRLVLRFNDPPRQPRSGPTDPSLHILNNARTVVTTDGSSYRLSDGHDFPISDVTAVAAVIRRLGER